MRGGKKIKMHVLPIHIFFPDKKRNNKTQNIPAKNLKKAESEVTLENVAKSKS